MVFAPEFAHCGLRSTLNGKTAVPEPKSVEFRWYRGQKQMCCAPDCSNAARMQVCAAPTVAATAATCTP